ncbi:MAG: glycosyl transferase group 1 [Chthonomonadaceae bacterium]|nr:glycosyl transferase group 1 [Chthonomonadaceae bacterium]
MSSSNRAQGELLPNGPNLTVGFLGHMPALLGGGGLEGHMRDLAAALSERGIVVVDVYKAERERVDVLHAFSTEPNVWHALKNWSRNRCPLVVTPTLVLDRKGMAAVRMLSRTPIGVATSVSMRRDIIKRADSLACLTHHEMAVSVRWLGADSAKSFVLGNASMVPAQPSTHRVGEKPVLIVGAISERKRQAEALRALAGSGRMIVAGQLACGEKYEATFRQSLAYAGAGWVGHVERDELWEIQSQARALVLFSRAEGESLAVLDSLALGVPVLLSDIPTHRELHARYPSHVFLVKRARELPSALSKATCLDANSPNPLIPTWHDVAERLANSYSKVLRP